jgi:hypothetical protein
MRANILKRQIIKILNFKKRTKYRPQYIARNDKYVVNEGKLSCRCLVSSKCVNIFREGVILARKFWLAIPVSGNAVTRVQGLSSGRTPVSQVTQRIIVVFYLQQRSYSLHEFFTSLSTLSTACDSSWRFTYDVEWWWKEWYRSRVGVWLPTFQCARFEWGYACTHLPRVWVAE